VLSFRSGGFFDQPRTAIAIGAWSSIAVLALARPSLLVPPTRVGRVAVVALLGLAAWTAASELWAPLIESARQDTVRLALYAAVLPLAVGAFGSRTSVRWLEVGLAALALTVIGYGLLGELGVVGLDSSVSAAGRLEQPLSYWNATAAIAAMGLVLAARIAADRSRARISRVAAAVATAPLAVGLYLTYSRGGIAAALAGLLALVLLVPEAARIWARLGARGRPVVAAVAAVGLAIAIGVVVADRESTPARGATATRLADVGSTRGDYWRVALGAFESEPLRGTGTAGFAVEWLREREVPEAAVDAHSLYIETAAELGIVGLLLLLTSGGGVAVCAVRAYGRDPAAVAGPAAALIVLAFHCAVDWDWEMPAVAIPMLLLAGALVAQAGEPGAEPRSA